MRKHKFIAFDKKTKKTIPFSLGDIYGYEGEVCGVVLPDKYTLLNHNSGYSDSFGINDDLIIVESTGLFDMDGEEVYFGDKDSFGRVVEYVSGCYCLNGDIPLIQAINSFKKVGNIYEPQ